MSQGAETPLLSGTRSLEESRDEYDGPASVRDVKASWGADFKDIVHLAGPAILQLSFQQAVIVTNQSMAGHLGPDELAAAAIAVTWFNLMWFFIIGASSALDTLASQAFGAGDRFGVLAWATSSIVVLSIMAIPMAVALYCADSVAAVIFQQPAHICKLVGIYCHGILPGLWPFIWSLVIIKTMQAQNLMWGPTLVTVGMFLANIVINVGLIKLAGFTGAAYAQSVSRIALFLFLLVYVTTFGKGCIGMEMADLGNSDSLAEQEVLSTTISGGLGPSDEMSGASRPPHTPCPALIHDSAGSSPPVKSYVSDDEPPPRPASLWTVVKDGCSFDRLFVFLQLGTAGGLMMAADASSFDITTAMAGFLGVEQVGAHTCLLTVIEFIFTSFPYGIATAATIRVGNMLGAGNAVSARQSAYLCLGGCGCFNIAMMLLFFAFGDYVGLIFTDDPHVVKLVARLSILGGLYQIPDCIYGSISGVLRGTGRQASLMWSNLAGFWGVGMPLCYLLAFKFGLGIEGLWIGLIAGLSTSAFLVLVMMLILDWEKEAEEAQHLATLQSHDENMLSTYSSEAPNLGERDDTHELARHMGTHRSSSAPLPFRSARSNPQLAVGSLTGSYARPMNNHL